MLATTHFPLLRVRRFLFYLDRPDSWSCAWTAGSQPPLWLSRPAPGASLGDAEGDGGGNARTGLSVSRARYKPSFYGEPAAFPEASPLMEVSVNLELRIAL